MSGDRQEHQPLKRPELLAPAGGRAQLEAAVWAGADAVYFGLDTGLNARVRATSFRVDELQATLDYLHERGVRGYLTLNTLVFDEELARAEALVRTAASAGADALIVQDIGLLELARAVAPALPVHGSTQMSVTDAAGVELAAQLGCRRVVLGRELSIEDISTIARHSRTEIEVFVHGALCVSYSGQCFSSEAWGGRSANRGQCAQACRLPYGLLVDGELREQGDLNYLLSPQDLMALEQLPRLVHTGVSCFKIEGRLKGPDYVLATVSAYREAIDRISGSPQDAPAANHYHVDNRLRRRLGQVFSRGQDAAHDGLTPGFLEGPRHQSLVIGRNPRHRGLFVGEVEAVTRRGVHTRLHGPVKRGDGLVFDRGRPEQREVGGNIHHVIDKAGESLTDEVDSGRVELRFGGNFALSHVHAGDLIWRTRDASQDTPAVLTPRLAARPVPVDVVIDGCIGRPLTLTVSDHDGNRVSIDSAAPLQPATGAPLDVEKLRKAIGTLGDSPFAIASLNLGSLLAAQAAFVPVGEIKAVRRRAIEDLLAARRRHQRAADMPDQPVLPRLLPAAGSLPAATEPRLSLLCRTREQVDAALTVDGIDEIVVDFLEVHGLKPACAAVRDAGRRLVVAAPRVFKPGEQRLWLYYCRIAPDALLVRSAGLLWQLQQAGGTGALLDDGETRIPALFGDFSLNAANVLGTRRLLAMGLSRLAPTHDLNSAQIAALARSLTRDERARIEVIAHQHLPIFHTEYCLFARFLSDGNSYRDCGRPCEAHVVHVRDPGGGDHLVQADIGCRNTVFNAAAQTAGPVLRSFREAGIGYYRIEFVDEPATEVGDIVAAYRDTLDGRANPEQLRRVLTRVSDANGNRQGVGLGSLAVRAEPARGQMKKPTAR